jgi:hypothetical protein
MAKRGIDAASASQLIKTRCAQQGWSLCVGAGTSLSANVVSPSPFPMWGDLVERVLRRADPGFPSPVSASALRSFSFDALIQAARDRLAGTDEEFSAALSEVLYADLRAAIGEAGWKSFTRCLEARRPGDCQRGEWLAFHGAAAERFPHLTALGVAEALAEVVGTPLAPHAILSFNAEPLLYALLNAATALKSETKGPGKQWFDRVTRSVSPRRRERIPYYFCHGLLPVDGGSKLGHRTTSLDKLVFSESEYLELANTSFAWQSSVFLGACTTSKVFFLGLSMTDPNMRRWLAWAHDNRLRELGTAEEFDGDSTAHFWINKLPGSDSEKEWIEHSMAHLGVRLIWVKEWTDTVPLLRDMLGLPRKA